MNKKMYLVGSVFLSMMISCEKHQASNKVEENVDSLKEVNKTLTNQIDSLKLVNAELVDKLSKAEKEKDEQLDTQNAVQVAIDFINIYTDKDKFSYNLATSNFSGLYKKWQSSDFIEYDRIVNGQDFGNKYKLSKILKVEGSSVYVLLTATQGWVGYKIPVKVIKVNGKWLVDGAGDLNIPKSFHQYNG